MAYYLDNTELFFFNEGNSAYAYKSLGCHRKKRGQKEVWRFAVWAPNARAVSVIGTFNNWNSYEHPMRPCGSTGVWELHIGTAHAGDLYKYAIVQPDGQMAYKADPYAVKAEKRPGTASVVYELTSYPWTDKDYYKKKKKIDPYHSPMSIYEVHLGSWKEGLNYREMAERLPEYVSDMGYTHIELMPLSEHPLDMSWGYQVTGYYAITSRYGSPEDLQYFVDCCHAKGLGVIMDWVPAHFPRDAHGLRRFDGTALYENPDDRRGEQPQWGTMLFDYGRTQVQSFLISNAVYFLKEYHIDALRVDAVSCMLYHDYGKENGEWLPNEYGGRENLDAIAFLRKLAQTVGREVPGSLLMAEESTSFPQVTAPPEAGGLGFNFKWNMGWMNDTLDYMSMDSVYRKWHHDKLTFSLYYAFSENFVLPFSHDEVVHGKRSLIGRMPGDYWQQFAQLRLLFGYQYGHPGKKLMFMGCEFGQFIEWNFNQSLDWLLLDYPKHREMQEYVRALNHFYKKNPPMYECDTGWDGFEWMQVDDRDQSIAIFTRKDKKGNEILCAYNFTPVPHGDYRIGSDRAVALKELLNSDDPKFGGTGDWMNGYKRSRKEPWNAREHTISLKLPPYGAVFLAVKDAPRRTSNKAKSKK
ncbi:MAG: 1,4-alpha-glucan branching protein GlgB [Clostridia bacterium]|nr:1,4-alpha-glucan branching protein GlgB [Clostridia bacterium]